jgi:ADP-ribosylglycohydrolase
MRSSGLVAELIARNVLPIAPGALEALGDPPVQGPVDLDRVEGMLLGLAIGDALGNTTEAMLPGKRHRIHGEIRDYLPNRWAGGARVGVPSDDTQLAFWTLEILLDHHRVVPELLMHTFASRQIFGIGGTVRAACDAFKAGKPWHETAQRSAGNGAVMRVPPVALPHLLQPSRDLWGDAVLAGAVTHLDRSSIGACVAMVGIVYEALGMPSTPPASWWLDAYCARAKPLEGEAHLVPRAPGLAFEGPVWRLVDTEVRQALGTELATRAAFDRWYSAAFLLETVPCALYTLARHAGDPEEAIVRAVNDTKDSDTVGAIVGAAVGALHGRRALPDRWVRGLLGRTGASDDGRIFALIAAARARLAAGKW